MVDFRKSYVAASFLYQNNHHSNNGYFFHKLIVGFFNGRSTVLLLDFSPKVKTWWHKVKLKSRQFCSLNCPHLSFLFLRASPKWEATFEGPAARLGAPAHHWDATPAGGSGREPARLPGSHQQTGRTSASSWGRDEQGQEPAADWEVGSGRANPQHPAEGQRGRGERVSQSEEREIGLFRVSLLNWTKKGCSIPRNGHFGGICTSLKEQLWVRNQCLGMISTIDWSFSEIFSSVMKSLTLLPF